MDIEKVIKEVLLKMRITNASNKPKIFYGLHMVPGVAEYRDQESGDPYRIYLNENTVKDMDKTFAGLPVYVDHVDKVDMKNLQVTADGFVIESFYNKADGKHWVKFIVVSDAGQQAITKGWKLSNAYIPKSFTGGGLNHGVEYLKEVTMAEYEHLAIVENPRYEESIILTPEQFKNYNSTKEQELELLRVANEKEKTTMFYKKEAVKNSAELESMSVTLPLSKKEVSVSEAIKIADKFENLAGYAAPDHMVKLADESEMSVKDLTDCYNKMKNDEMELKKKNETAEAEAKKNAEEEEKRKANMSEEEKAAEAKKNAEEEEKKKNAEKEAADKKANEEKSKKEEEEKKKNGMDYYEALKNAHVNPTKEAAPISMPGDGLARGREMFGSN